MKSAELRKTFLSFFEKKGHAIMPSSSLIPANDPTLLFTNAGMVPFKDVFRGEEHLPHSRVTTSQRCVRAGGKHNDLENVGYTARHHTFFEMLGNFSFGDYFKREAIAFAWEFLTEVLKLPAERLWVTVFRDDDEAADIWLKEMKIDPTRFSRCGERDNFWSMGDTGPCGPCSEIFYDHGPDIPGAPPGTEDDDSDRYVEIWNLVFMQYDRKADGTLTPLPTPSVDTGMGLERLAAVVQGVHNNFDIDSFQHLIQVIAKLAQLEDTGDKSLRVIADHIRSTVFLILDGVVPSNEGRGYVLRRIMRRAIRHGSKIGLQDEFFYRLVAPLVEEMGSAYPELIPAKARLEMIIQQEEQQFAKTLEQGLKVLEHEIAEMGNDCLPGDVIFRLYDTYGFPVDLTSDIARERGLQVDLSGFETCMQRQREQSQSASHFTNNESVLDVYGETIFSGYDHLADTANITQLFRDNAPVKQLKMGEKGILVLSKTPFYAEGGGQVGDVGFVQAGEHQFVIHNTQSEGATYLHYGEVVRGTFHVGDEVTAHVDGEHRQATALNHSATHLMHEALRQVLGEHVIQKGSLVDSERLRFDFSHFQPITSEELLAIELLVNAQIRANHAVATEVMSLDEAKASGAMALFGEKYAERVRVLHMGDFSVEVCGGTHVKRTGDLGLFKILNETGVAAGIRRIEAVTGAKALQAVAETESQLQALTHTLKVDRENLNKRVHQMVETHRILEKDLARLKQKMATQTGTDLVNKARIIHEVNVLAASVEGNDVKVLRNTLDQLKQKLGSAVIVLAQVQGEQIHLVAGITADYTDKLHAGELIKFIAEQLNGRGGGRSDMAQGGGSGPDKLPSALETVYAWVDDRLTE